MAQFEPTPYALRVELSIKVTRDDSGETVLLLSGALDLVSKQEVIDIGLRELDRAGCRRLVLNMGGIGFIDSTGLSALIILDNEAQSSDATVVIQEPSARVDRLLEISGLRDRFVRE
jgi:anti-sigma B factor antagonist